ncbi:MAG: radical SAM protein [Chloroflexi bacterium]|nr:radical SAM protein [Chloroflexota bacterium]
MTNFLATIRQRFAPLEPLSPGVYHYQAPDDAAIPYRLHLRLDPGGKGLLIVNAATVLHLNQTAAEYAYYLVQQVPEDEAARQVAKRYRVTEKEAREDFENLKSRLLTLIEVPDLDPVTFLDFERDAPYSGDIPAPYRLDCALTYRLPDSAQDDAAPTKRVERELSTEEWGTIIDKAWDAGIPHIIFTGGEPTLRDDLFDLIEHAESNGQVTGLLSDGRRLANESYLQALLQTGLDHLMIILHPEDEAAWAALNKVLPEDLHTTVHLTISPENAVGINSVLERLAKMGTNAISLSAVSSELNDVLEASREQAAALELSLVWDIPVPYSDHNPIALETVEEQQPQGAGRAWLYVEPDGDVLPAQGINQVQGNILREPWKDVWEK